MHIFIVHQVKIQTDNGMGNFPGIHLQYFL